LERSAISDQENDVLAMTGARFLLIADRRSLIADAPGSDIA
jgi:hypothetical protein